MAAVKKTNIVSLVAVMVIVFSVTIHGFPDGVKVTPKHNEGKPETAGDETKKLADENAATGGKANEKTPGNAESEKKPVILRDEIKAGADKLADEANGKQAPKSDEKPAEKSDKGDKKE